MLSSNKKFFKGDFFLYIIYLLLAMFCLHCYTGFSLIAESEGYSSLLCSGFSLQWLLLLWRRLPGMQASGAAARGLRACGPRAQAQWLWCAGLAASCHVGSSQIKDQTCVSYIRSWIIYC